MLDYHAAFYPADNGWYVVSLLDFPGVNSQGKNLREARMMIKDALKLMAESYLEDGRTLPIPDTNANDPAAKRHETIRC